MVKIYMFLTIMVKIYMYSSYYDALSQILFIVNYILTSYNKINVSHYPLSLT